MNLDLKHLNSFSTKFLQGVTHPSRVRPGRDWAVIAGVTLVLIIGVGFWSWWLYGAMTAPQSASAPTMGSGAATAPLNAVESVFATRAMLETHYLTDYHFVDPSK